ncbi:phospholipase-like protein [Tanacetum coccineum]
MLELVNKDVKFAKLDDEDAIHVCLLLALDFVFMGNELRHVVSKPIVNLVDVFYKWGAFPWGEYMWSFFHKRDYNVAVSRRTFHLEKLASNPKYEANYVLYGFVFQLKVTHSIPVLRSATKGSSKGKSFHTRVWTEVRHEVHVRTEVSRVHSKEELRKKLKPGPSDVDHLDKTGNLSKNAPDCGLDQQSMGGVSQCMNVDEPYKNWNDVLDNFHADCLDHKSVEGKSFVIDSPQFKFKDNEEACHSDFCLSTQQVQDACVSELLDVLKDDVNVNSVVNEDIDKDDVHVDSFVKEDIEKDDVQFDSVVKDAEQIENETLPRQKFPGKAYLSPYIQPPSTEVKCRKRHREIKLEKVEKKSSKLLLGRMELKLNCYHGKRKPNVDWAMASPDLCNMLSQFQYPLYYVDGVKYGVPWFANNVQKVYFPIKENDSHWVLGELHISSGSITIYDSLGCPPNGIETRLFWLDLREKLQFQIPLFLDNAEVFEKKNIVKDDYSISFQYADGVPIQGGFHGDYGLWVCIFLYRLSHNIPLEVDDPISFALAYRERLIKFYWKYKMLPG